MSHDRITELRISGMRVIDDLTLPLDGLTVLIGDNGSGKSTILEALELLRLAAKPVHFVPDVLLRRHGGLGALLRRGASELTLGVTIEGDEPALSYEFTVASVGSTPMVRREQLAFDPLANYRATPAFLTREGVVVDVAEVTRDAETTGRGGSFEVDGQQLALPRFAHATRNCERVLSALEAIEVHPPFDVRPLWQQHDLAVADGPRWPALVEPTNALSPYGRNLANAFQAVRNLGDEVWQRVISQARLGLGDDVRGFRLTSPMRTRLELELVLGSAPDQPLPAEYLSEGQLAYLCFVALVELNRDRSVLAFDEPELHLHPALLARVVWMLEEVAETSPVILATHSDGLLDALEHPDTTVVLCELDEHGAARLRRPGPQLAQWMESYSGVGSLRAEGYEPHVFDGGPPVARNSR